MDQSLAQEASAALLQDSIVKNPVVTPAAGPVVTTETSAAEVKTEPEAGVTTSTEVTSGPVGGRRRRKTSRKSKGKKRGGSALAYSTVGGRRRRKTSRKSKGGSKHSRR